MTNMTENFSKINISNKSMLVADDLNYAFEKRVESLEDFFRSYCKTEQTKCQFFKGTLASTMMTPKRATWLVKMLPVGEKIPLSYYLIVKYKSIDDVVGEKQFIPFDKLPVH